MVPTPCTPCPAHDDEMWKKVFSGHEKTGIPGTCPVVIGVDHPMCEKCRATFPTPLACVWGAGRLCTLLVFSDCEY